MLWATKLNLAFVSHPTNKSDGPASISETDFQHCLEIVGGEIGPETMTSRNDFIIRTECARVS